MVAAQQDDDGDGLTLAQAETPAVASALRAANAGPAAELGATQAPMDTGGAQAEHAAQAGGTAAVGHSTSNATVADAAPVAVVQAGGTAALARSARNSSPAAGRGATALRVVWPQ